MYSSQSMLYDQILPPNLLQGQAHTSDFEFFPRFLPPHVPVCVSLPGSAQRMMGDGAALWH